MPKGIWKSEAIQKETACNICGRVFDSRRAMICHKNSAVKNRLESHRMIKVISYCLNCKKEIETLHGRQFCSYKCHSQYLVKNGLHNFQSQEYHKLVSARQTKNNCMKNPETVSKMRKNMAVTMRQKSANRQLWNQVDFIKIDYRYCKHCNKLFTVRFDSKKKYCNEKCSESDKTGKNNPMYGKKCPVGSGYSKMGHRKDLNCYFRSSWEANFARILNLLNFNWVYEKDRIYLRDCSYLPDFYLPEFSLYIEVKGKEKDHKLDLLHKELPNFPIKIVDSDVYKKLKSMYKEKIPNWEV